MSILQENFLTALKDDEKWSASEFEIKAQWVAHLHRHHSKIATNSATDENVDLFFLKLWGLIDEFDLPLKTTVTMYKKMNDFDSDLYTHCTSQEEKLKTKSKLDSYVPSDFSKYIDVLDEIVGRVESIRQKFSEEDLLLLLDYRTHTAHPTADFYRLSLGKSGKLRDKYRSKSRAEIQKILYDEYRKHRKDLGEQTTNKKVAKYFANKITEDELKHLGALVVEAAFSLNPLMALSYVGAPKT